MRPTPFPIETDSQRIGQNAKSAFDALRPLTWRVQDLSGDDDVGLDFLVQVVVDGEYRYSFHAQVKGTEHPNYVRKDNFLAVNLKTSTLNYYQNIAMPVMLVVCDLSKNIDPRKAVGYYVWIHDQLKDILGNEPHIDDVQQTHTIHVPIDNHFTSELYVADYCTQVLQLKRAADGLFDAISQTYDEPANVNALESINAISDRVRHQGRLFLESISSESTTPWLQAPQGSIARRLADVDEQLRRFDHSRASEILETLDENPQKYSKQEDAEYQYLLGRVHSLQGNHVAASHCYKKAVRRLGQEPKYIVAWTEEQINRYASLNVERVCRRLLRMLPKSDREEIVALKCKLLAAVGNHEEAFTTISQLPTSRQHLQYGLLYTIRNDWMQVKETCERGLKDPSIAERHRGHLLILKARATFNVMLERTKFATGESPIPLTGPAGVDSKLLNECWTECYAALKFLSRMGWPLEVENLAEFISIPAVASNNHHSILQDLHQAAARRPHLTALQASLEHVAIACGDLPIALEAISRQPKSHELSRRKAFLSYDSGDKSQTLAVVLEELERQRGKGEEPDPQLIAIGAVAAHDLLDITHETELSTQLGMNPDWGGDLATYNYLVRISDSPLETSAALGGLLQAYEEFPSNALVLGTLLPVLDTKTQEGARIYIEILERVTSERQIAFSETMKLAEAHLTLEDWQALRSLANDAMVRFEENDRVVALKALSLECSGETGQALRTLGRILDKGKHEPLALNMYINIAVRCGFAGRAIEQATRMLQQEDDSDRRKELLRLLFILKMNSDAPKEELYNIAWRYGRLVNRADEVDEGMFLQLYFFATQTGDVEIPNSHVSEFQQRLETYVQEFPKSQLLRSVCVPESEDAGEFLRVLERELGFDDERRRWIKKTVRELHEQAAPIPFAWRPRNVLVNVGDIFHLWEISKNSSKDAKEFHLAMFLNAKGTRPNLHRLEEIPILDLLSLITVSELELLDVLFLVFGRIAITKSTLLDLQSLSGPYVGSLFRNSAKMLVETLRGRIDSIIQPGDPQGGRPGRRWRELESAEELKELVRSDRFVGYSDDAFMRLYLDESEVGGDSICTYDLLIEAERRGILSNKEIGNRIAKLAKWNVIGVPVSMSHLFCILPEEIDSTQDPTEVLREIESSVEFCGLIDAIWDYRRAYLDTLDFLARLLVFLSRQRNLNPGLMAAIWKYWLNKVRLRVDEPVESMVHLGRTMVVAGDKLRVEGSESNGRGIVLLDGKEVAVEAEPRARKLWTAFRSVLEMEFGESMTELKEMESIDLVGGAVAALVGDDTRRIDAEAIMKVLENGFVVGTAEHTRFVEAYSSSRVKILTQSGEDLVESSERSRR